MLETFGPITRTIALAFTALTLTATASGVYVGGQMLLAESAPVSSYHPPSVTQPLASR